MGPLKRKFLVKLVPEKQNDYPLIWYQNIGRMFFRLVTKHVCDGERDERTEVQSQYLARTAALHSKNVSWNTSPAYKYDNTTLHI